MTCSRGTFLFTDLEGSRRLWEQYPESMKKALARHDAVLLAAISANNGHVVKRTGDGVHAAFVDASDAVRAAIGVQRALGAESWDDIDLIRVRIGIHTGPAEVRDGDYYGTAVNRAARLRCRGTRRRAATRSLATGACVQVEAAGSSTPFPPLRSLDAFPTNLRVQVTSFVARERDIDAIVDAVDTSRLVTIVGVGGVGKTGLAIQVAAEMLPRYSGHTRLERADRDDAPTEHRRSAANTRDARRARQLRAPD